MIKNPWWSGRTFRFKPLSALKETFALPRDLKLMFFANFLWDSGDGLYSFILPVYIQDLGGTILEVGLFYLLMNAIYFSSMFLGGFLADRFERKKLVLLYFIITMPTPLIYSFATSWQHLIPGAILYNFALFSPAINAYVATAAQRKRTARAFALTKAGYSLGMTFSPLIGAYLLTIIDIKWLFKVAFVFFSTSLITLSFISPQIPKKEQRRSVVSDFAVIVRNKRLMSWVLLFIPTAFASSLSIYFISPLLKDLYSFQKPAILVFGSIISAGEVILAALLSWVGDQYGSSQALIASLGMIIAGMFFLPFPTFSLLLPLAAFLIGARRVSVSLCSSVVGKYSVTGLRGSVFGIYMVLMGIGETCGPYVGGVLYQSSPTQPFICTSISLIVLSFLILTLQALTSKRNATSASEN